MLVLDLGRLSIDTVKSPIRPADTDGAPPVSIIQFLVVSGDIW